MSLPKSPRALSRPLHGIWRLIPSPFVSELLAQAGLDFQILDCEHGAYDWPSLAADIIACEGQRCAPLVRVSGANQVEVQRCLDLGAHGLVFPRLAAREDFARAAEMMDHPPAGTRGFNPAVRSLGYGGGPPPAGARPARPWFVPIIETLAAVGQLDEILQLERIDLVYIGSFDLSAQLGCAGKLDDPKVVALIEGILIQCQRVGKAVALVTLTPETTRTLAARGVQALVHGESACFRQAVAALVPAHPPRP